MSSNASIAFGSGVLIATPGGANATPIQFGALQDCSIDFSFTSKNLFGQYQFPIAFGRGEAKISGKAKFANIDGAIFNQIFLAGAPVGAQKLWAYNEGTSVPSAAPYTVSCANASAFDSDLGVVYAATGAPLSRTASAPTQGQYSVTSGVYTFAAADAGKALLLSYAYTQPATGSGSRTVIGNALMGAAPTFQIDFYQRNPNIAGAQWSMRLYSCSSTKLSFASKTSDFTIPELDFQAFANAANQVGEINAAT